LHKGRVASGSYDKRVRVWSATGACEAVLKGHEMQVTGLCVLDDGRLASSSNDKTVRIWELDGTCKRIVEANDMLNSVCCMRDGRLATAANNGEVRIWSTRPVRTVNLFQDHQGQVNCVAHLEGGGLVSGSQDNSMRIRAGDEFAEDRDEDEELLVKELRIVGFEQLTVKYHASPVWAVACLGNGKVASGTADGHAHIWSVHKGGLTETLLKGHTGAVRCVANLGNGRVATGSEDCSLRIWAADGQAEKVLKGNSKNGSKTPTLRNSKTPKQRLSLSQAPSREGRLRLPPLSSVASAVPQNTKPVLPGLDQAAGWDPVVDKSQ